MQSIGRNDTMSVPGLCTPTMATIRPSVAAMLYAGAVEETAITTLEISPSAPARRPLSDACWPVSGTRTLVSWARRLVSWARRPVFGGAVGSAITVMVIALHRLLPGAGCPGYGDTVSQYHIAVQVLHTRIFVFFCRPCPWGATTWV